MPVAVIGNDRAEEPFVSPQSPMSGGFNNSMGNPPMMNPVRTSPTRLSPTRLLRQLTPPILLPLGKAVMRLGRQSQFEYVTDRLPGDEPRGEGWDHDSIVAAQCRRWPDFLTAIRSTAPLGVSHEASQIGTDNPSAHNAILAFSYVLGRAAVGRSRPSVLDWGGGLGYYGAIATAVYPEIAFDYTVYDLPKICAAGSPKRALAGSSSAMSRWSRRRRPMSSRSDRAGSAMKRNISRGSSTAPSSCRPPPPPASFSNVSS
jgi:hypothetical protein